MGFQFLGPRSTVLSPSDPRSPTVGTFKEKSSARASMSLRQPLYSVVFAANSWELHYAMRLAKTEAGPYAWGVFFAGSCLGMSRAERPSVS